MKGVIESLQRTVRQRRDRIRVPKDQMMKKRVYLEEREEKKGLDTIDIRTFTPFL